MRNATALFAAGAVLFCSAIAGAAGDAGMPADPAPFAARWQEMRGRLGAEDYWQREAAQAELGKWPYQDYDALDKQLKAEQDPEIRVRLGRGLDEIAVERFTHPAPVSIDFDQASLQRVVNQLNAALGEQRIAPSWESRDKYTLHLKDAPFWEVIAQLNRQHPLVVTGSSGWGLTPTYSGMQGFTYTGVMAAWATINRTPGAPLPGIPPTWNMAVTLAADPRVTVARCMGVRWIEIQDDAPVNGGRGNDLLMGVEQQGATPLGSSTYRTNLLLKVPAAAGKKIRIMRGEASVSLVTREEEVVLADAKKQANQVLRLPQGTMQVTSLEKYGESMQLDLAFARAAPIAQNGAAFAVAGGQNVIVIAGGAGQVQIVANALPAQAAPLEQLQAQQAALLQMRVAQAERQAMFQAQVAALDAELQAMRQRVAADQAAVENNPAAVAQAMRRQAEVQAAVVRQMAQIQQQAAVANQALALAQARLVQATAEATPVPLSLQELPVTVQVVVDGKVAGTYSVTSNLSVRFPATQKPVKLILRHAAGVQEAKLPVELRGLDLP